jgi:hypothetical protein
MRRGCAVVLLPPRRDSRDPSPSARPRKSPRHRKGRSASRQESPPSSSSSGSRCANPIARRPVTPVDHEERTSTRAPAPSEAGSHRGQDASRMSGLSESRKSTPPDGRGQIRRLRPRVRTCVRMRTLKKTNKSRPPRHFSRRATEKVVEASWKAARRFAWGLRRSSQHGHEHRHVDGILRPIAVFDGFESYTAQRPLPRESAQTSAILRRLRIVLARRI